MQASRLTGGLRSSSGRQQGGAAVPVAPAGAEASLIAAAAATVSGTSGSSTSRFPRAVSHQGRAGSAPAGVRLGHSPLVPPGGASPPSGEDAAAAAGAARSGTPGAGAQASEAAEPVPRPGRLPFSPPHDGHESDIFSSGFYATTQNFDVLVVLCTSPLRKLEVSRFNLYY